VARLGFVRPFQISAVFPHMTALENVRVALQRKRGDSFDFWRSQKALAQFDEEARSPPADVGLAADACDLSYGRKRALKIATPLALDLELLLLDEPMAGMSQQDVERISALIRRISADRTVFDGRAQPLCRRLAVGCHHRPGAQRGAAGGHLRGPVSLLPDRRFAVRPGAEGDPRE